MNDGMENRTRAEILRLVSELEAPVGAEKIAGKLADLGIAITVDGVRYHLQILDKLGFTRRVSTRGRVLTPAGWEELRRTPIHARLMHALVRWDVASHQVTLDTSSGSGLVVGALTIFPADQLPVVLLNAARVCQAGFCVSDRMALLGEGDSYGSYMVPSGKRGLVAVSSITHDGLLLSRGLASRLTFGGAVEIVAGQPTRFIDVFELGRSSMDPLGSLARQGITRVQDIVEGGSGILLADIRELVGVARPRALGVMKEAEACGLGGILAVGQIGQPVLGIPVQHHNYGAVVVAGINATVAAYEVGVPAEFHCIEGMVDFASLRTVASLLAEAGVNPALAQGQPTSSS